MPFSEHLMRHIVTVWHRQLRTCHVQNISWDISARSLLQVSFAEYCLYKETYICHDQNMSCSEHLMRRFCRYTCACMYVFMHIYIHTYTHTHTPTSSSFFDWTRVNIGVLCRNRALQIDCTYMNIGVFCRNRALLIDCAHVKILVFS